MHPKPQLRKPYRPVDSKSQGLTGSGTVDIKRKGERVVGVVSDCWSSAWSSLLALASLPFNFIPALLLFGFSARFCSCGTFDCWLSLVSQSSWPVAFAQREVSQCKLPRSLVTVTRWHNLQRFLWTGSPGRQPLLSHSSWTLTMLAESDSATIHDKKSSRDVIYNWTGKKEEGKKTTENCWLICIRARSASRCTRHLPWACLAKR